MTDPYSVPPSAESPAPWIRGAFGGVLMGLANLVPGISGGTMLLAAGIYTRFVDAVAEVTTFKFRRPSLLLLGVVVFAALAVILLLAGPVKDLVVGSRWVMYSLFIGLTLGGVPLVWRLAKPPSAAFYGGSVCGVAAMVLLSMQAVGQGGSPGTLMLFLSGAAGAAAMILPGVSGGYLLLVLGSYVAVLGEIDRFKSGLSGDLSVALDAARGLAPFALGIVVSIIAMSNLLRWLLKRFPQPTLGVLLGLLLGAVVGIWPFQEGVKPRPGDVVRGEVMTGEKIGALPPGKWPLRTYAPTAGRAGTALVLVALGLGATLLIDRLGGRRRRS